MTEGFPKEFIERVAGQESVDTDSLIAALSDPSPVSVRLNRKKWDNDPVSGEMVPWCDAGFYLPHRPVFTLDPLLHAGCYYVQEASSMFLEVLFREVEGEREGLRILDMSASPGGKTTHLSSLAGADALLVANEPIRSRIGPLAENIIRWGVPNTIISNSDPDDFNRLPHYFDIVIVDAPCSGEGMFRKAEVRDLWSVSGCEICSDRQKRILRAAWQSLKPGGHLIYSTCTFNPGENESNIRWLIDNYGAKVVHAQITPFTGIEELGDSQFLGYGFYPGRVRGEGFFISAVQSPETEWRGEAMRPKRRQQETANAIPSRVSELVSSGGGRIQQSGDTFWYYPAPLDEVAFLGERVNLVKRGTEICTMKRDSVIPAHDLCMSTVMAEGAFPSVDISYRNAIRFLRRDNLVIKDEVRAGWCAVTYEGVRLGFVNNIGTRLNNYFPANSRIRMDESEREVRVLV